MPSEGFFPCDELSDGGSTERIGLPSAVYAIVMVAEDGTDSVFCLQA